MSAQAVQQPRRVGFTVSAATVAVVHTYLAFGAFFTALFVGCLLHYKKIVKNGVAGWPEEWFPSVSATIGDWYPERNLFQILIAINSGPRFAVVFLQYLIQRNYSSTLPTVLFITGVLRTLSCGGWVFITSNDDHDWHDILMISYIVLNLPWMIGGVSCTPPQNIVSRRRRRLIASTFFGSLVPMIYFFIQHKVHRVPGAYTHYSFFEWGLIILDVLYDSVAAVDFKAANLQITIGNPSTEKSGASTEIAAIGSDGSVYSVQLTSEVTVEEKVIVRKPIPEPPANDTPKTGTRNLLRQVVPAWSFLCDVYLSYVNWSIFTSLTPTLFYFSVWKLAIAGSEFSLLATLSPIVLGIPVLRDIFSSRAGRTVLYGLSLAGLAAYLLESPSQRLMVVGFANFAMCIGWTIDWTVPVSSLGYQGTITGLGLLLHSLSKHANHSNNPIWPFIHGASGGYNKTGIALTCIAIYNYYTRQQNPASPVEGEKTHSAGATPLATRKHWLLDGYSFGSLLFTLHCFISDGSTLIAWSWTGYPIKGPLPNLHGSLTHVAQAIGLLLPILLSGSPVSRILSHPLWFAYGCAGLYVTYAYKDWTGYIGGLNFALFLSSIIPLGVSRAGTNGHIAKTFMIAMLTTALFDVINTFTVAYAFVPGGEYFRERTDMVLMAQMAGIAFAFDWPFRQVSAPALTMPKSVKRRAKNLLGVFTILSLLATLYHWPVNAPKPHRPGPRILRAGIWTVHFGIDNEGRDSQRRMRDLIKDMELDVVGLLETDLQRVVYGNRDLTRVMAEELGFYVDIGPGPEKHTWGAVLLSKFPIINSTHHLLPSPHGELAPAIHAVLDMFGTHVNVIVAHNGQEETPLDRELQSIETARIMSSVYPEPLIYLGYVVTQPHAGRPAPYDIMVNDGRVHDIDKEDLDRWCQYIFYRGLYRTSYARVSRSTITDTELQIGQFVVPKYGVGITDDSEEGRYRRAWKEEMDPDHWFPPEYYLDQGGVRGHHYHVFNTPLYYKFPEGAVL